jgi:hypothetical protein
MAHVEDESNHVDDDLEDGELRDTEDEDDLGIHMCEKISEGTGNHLGREKSRPVSGRNRVAYAA